MMLTVRYGMSLSDNRQKVRLLLLQPMRSEACAWIEMDTTQGQTWPPGSLSLNRVGKVPSLVRQDGRGLAASGTILFWLAEATPYAPAG